MIVITDNSTDKAIEIRFDGLPHLSISRRSFTGFSTWKDYGNYHIELPNKLTMEYNNLEKFTRVCTILKKYID